MHAAAAARLPSAVFAALRVFARDAQTQLAGLLTISTALAEEEDQGALIAFTRAVHAADGKGAAPPGGAAVREVLGRFPRDEGVQVAGQGLLQLLEMMGLLEATSAAASTPGGGAPSSSPQAARAAARELLDMSPEQFLSRVASFDLGRLAGVFRPASAAGTSPPGSGGGSKGGKPRKPCLRCADPGRPTQVCSRCKAAHFCSRECQLACWKDGTHGKVECAELAAAAAARAAAAAAAGGKEPGRAGAKGEASAVPPGQETATGKAKDAPKKKKAQRPSSSAEMGGKENSAPAAPAAMK